MTGPEMARHEHQRHGETQVMLMGRDRERADVLDFLRYPPGSLTSAQRSFVDDLIRAIERCQHAGAARRLYDDAWADEGFAEGALESAPPREAAP